MAKMPKEVMDLFNDPEASKVLVTVDAAMTPNAAPKGSITAIDDETIAYAEATGGKTMANLETNKKVALVAFKVSPLVGYQVKGTFQEFQTSGDVFDKFSELLKPFGATVIGAGIIKVEEVYALIPSSKIA